VRALKSQLFGTDTVRRLRSARDGQHLGAADAETAADPDAAVDGSDLVRRRFRHLVASYTIVLGSYPSGQTLFRALFRLHEVENLKLAWRAHIRLHPFERWRSLWRPLGPLETVRLEDCRDQTSLAGLVASLRTTPYGALADTTFRAHADDLVASELAFDRWASASIDRAATGLGRAEKTARDLARAVVRERDLNLLRRGVQAFGLSPDAVLGSLVALKRELRAGELTRLATWTAQEGRILRAWPKAWKAGPDIPADWDALLVAVKRARRQACRRAFLASPYCLAPALALLLLQEEEVRGVVSIQESEGRPDANPALERALAASAMGI
jgi:vacuolar-type H+-ATPase subunit C/Vma6